MSETLIDQSPVLPFFDTVFRSLIEPPRPSTAVAPPTPEPWMTRAMELCMPAFEAPNVAAVKQALGEIAMSVQFCDLLLTIAHDDTETDAGSPIPTELSRRAKRLLGETAAQIFMQAADEARRVSDADVSSHVANSIREISAAGAETLAAHRHQLVLGGIVAASVARVVLSSLRGESALLALVCAANGVQPVQPWRAIALAEATLDGVRAAQRFLPISTSLMTSQRDRIDIGRAQLEQRRIDMELLSRLVAGEPLDDPDDTITGVTDD